MIDKRQARGAATRAALVATASEFLEEEGLERFVLRRISDRAGMTLGNLQYYFRTREDLLEEVFRVVFERDRAVLVEELAALRGRPADRGSWIPAVTERLVDNWCGAGGHACSAMQLLAAHQPRFAALTAEIYADFYAAFEPLIRAADPAVSDDEVPSRARLVTAVLDGAALQARAAVGNDRAECDGLLADVTALVTRIAVGGSREGRHARH